MGLVSAPLFVHILSDTGGNMQKLTVDIIIPTYKPDARFIELISRLEKQSRAAGRIIIVNTEKLYWEQAPFDKQIFQKENLENGSKVEVYHIPEEEFDHGGTRAFAASKSGADVLLFMTQDAMPADSCMVENLVKVWENERACEVPDGQAKYSDVMIGAAYARQLPSKDCHFLEQYTRSFNYGDESRIKSEKDLPELGIKTFFCSNVCAAYKRDIYEKMGGFEHQTIFNEDMIMAGHMIHQGYGIAYVADARVIHSHNYSALQQFRRNFDLAVSQTDHPEVFQGIRSESEGIRLVKKSAVYLMKNGKIWMLPRLIWQSGWKYLGYRMGRQYKKLPLWIIEKCTMNKKYWKNKVF